jgi:hypothetical protein
VIEEDAAVLNLRNEHTTLSTATGSVLRKILTPAPTL